MSWRNEISQPQYGMREMKRLRAPMRDGTHLSVDVFLPDTDRPFPALLAYSPYWNEGMYLPVPSANPHPTAAWGNYAIEAGDSAYLTARGYVHVVANVRGTGESEGEYQLMGRVEQEDGHDLIEWIAAQPWCDGNVGMIGVSYFSWIQYLVAGQQPPSLKAIAPLEGASDFYRDVCYKGGILSYGFLSYWNSELSDRDSTSRSERELTDDELHARIAQVKADNVDIQHLFSVYQLLNTPKKCPVLFDALLHPTDDDWYRERSGSTYFDRITIPVFAGAALDFWDLHEDGGIRAWAGLPASIPKKLLVYPRFHLRPFTENHDILVRWYDHWLKGNDTGMLDEPPIDLWVQGDDAWRNEQEWPLDRTTWTRLYLREGGALSREAPQGAETPDSFDNIPYVTLESTFGGVPHVTYSTEPMATPMEISGPMVLELFASLSDVDGNWIVEVRDVAPDGESRIVSKGWLKASFRALDEARSKPYRPEHPYDEAVPVVPGEVERYAIQVHDTSNVFLPGHRLELVIKSLDHSLEGGWNTVFYHLPCGREVTQTVRHDADHASSLLVPVIERA